MRAAIKKQCKLAKQHNLTTALGQISTFLSRLVRGKKQPTNFAIIALKRRAMASVASSGVEMLELGCGFMH